MKKLISLIFTSLLFFACSTSQETVKEESGGGEQVYVFDDVSSVTGDSSSVSNESVNDSLFLEQPKAEVENQSFIYFVQLGAFTTEERAERFKLMNQPKSKFPMNISFNNDLKLWVIRLPKFDSKNEAEKVRDELWGIDVFKDAFIVTVQE